jgi:hypothetical protein
MAGIKPSDNQPILDQVLAFRGSPIGISDKRAEMMLNSVS